MIGRCGHRIGYAAMTLFPEQQGLVMVTAPHMVARSNRKGGLGTTSTQIGRKRHSHAEYGRGRLREARKIHDRPESGRSVGRHPGAQEGTGLSPFQVSRPGEDPQRPAPSVVPRSGR